MEKKICAIYPGSFDPPTLGHLDIIGRAAHLFDELIVAIAVNSAKQPLFSVEERLLLLRECCAKLSPTVRVLSFEGTLLVGFAEQVGAQVIVRGLRAMSDFEYEYQMASINRQLNPEIETCILLTSSEFAFLSSSIVKEVARLQGDVSQLVPPNVLSALKEKFAS